VNAYDREFLSGESASPQPSRLVLGIERLGLIPLCAPARAGDGLIDKVKANELIRGKFLSEDGRLR